MAGAHEPYLTCSMAGGGVLSKPWGYGNLLVAASMRGESIPCLRLGLQAGAAPPGRWMDAGNTGPRRGAMSATSPAPWPGGVYFPSHGDMGTYNNGCYSPRDYTVKVTNKGTLQVQDTTVYHSSTSRQEGRHRTNEEKSAEL